MYWPIIDFLFNIIVLSGLIGLLIIIWMIILGIIPMIARAWQWAKEVEEEE